MLSVTIRHARQRVRYEMTTSAYRIIRCLMCSVVCDTIPSGSDHASNSIPERRRHRWRRECTRRAEPQRVARCSTPRCESGCVHRSLSSERRTSDSLLLVVSAAPVGLRRARSVRSARMRSTLDSARSARFGQARMDSRGPSASVRLFGRSVGRYVTAAAAAGVDAVTMRASHTEPARASGFQLQCYGRRRHETVELVYHARRQDRSAGRWSAEAGGAVARRRPDVAERASDGARGLRRGAGVKGP